MEITVHVNNMHGSQMAAKITGRFTVDGHSFRFTAIAFGRIGGQNIGAKISDATSMQLKRLGYDVDEVIMSLQSHLIRGQITIPEGLKKESFVDD